MKTKVHIIDRNSEVVRVRLEDTAAATFGTETTFY